MNLCCIKKTTANGAIVGLGVPTTAKNRFSYLLSGGKVRMEVQGTGSTGVWVHVACVYDDATEMGKLYVNGMQEGAGFSFESNVNTTATQIQIGNDYNVAPPGLPARGFAGALDGVRLYAGALSDATIFDLYQSPLKTQNFELNASITTYPNPVKNISNFSSNKVAKVD